MKNKKLLSLVLAGVMALSLVMPAFAADNTTEIAGTYQDVVIDVVVPATGKAFINPYGLDIKVPQDATDDSNTNKATISGQQIVSAPMALKNKTGMDLNVNATVTGTITALPQDSTSTLMKFTTATTKGVGSNPEEVGYVAPATGKAAFVYLQAKQEPTLTGADSTVTAADIAGKYAAWTASAYDANKDVVVAAKTVSKENIVILRAAQMNGDTFQSYKAGSIALFRLTGDCTSGAKAGWTEDDKFTVTVAFTFTPAQITKYDVNIAAVTSTGSGTATGVTVTPDVTKAAVGDTVTITVASMTSGDDATITVKGADNTVIAVAGGTIAAGNTTGTATFTMPAQAVTVSVVVNQ